MQTDCNLFKIKLFPVSILLIIFIVSCSSAENQTYNDSTINKSYNLDELNGYGGWINVSPYGRVWQPHVVSDWSPYDNGHWSYADGNWTWISYEPFGWIVYHYGNWYDDPVDGWLWVPSENVWSPARVRWIDYDGYVGWAPLSPEGINYGNPWDVNENRHWHVVKQKDFAEDNVRKYRVNIPVRNETGGRSIINTEPASNDIEKTAGRKITEVKVRNEAVKLTEREIKKMQLPPEEKKKVDQNTPRVKKEVLVPREEFHRKQSERKDDQKKDKRKN
jgi:hypothetical protein